MAHHWIASRPGGLDVFSFEEYDVAPPQSGEVTISVRAAGMNPADAKHVASGAGDFPRPVGYEVAGVVSAIGPDTEIASGPVALGDEVLAFRVSGGWATDLTVPARDVFAKPASLTFGEAANLLLAGTTAAEMLHVTGVAAGRHDPGARRVRSGRGQRPPAGRPDRSAGDRHGQCVEPRCRDALRWPPGRLRGRVSSSGSATPRRTGSSRRWTVWAPMRRSPCRSPWSPTATAS